MLPCPAKLDNTEVNSASGPPVAEIGAVYDAQDTKFLDRYDYARVGAATVLIRQSGATEAVPVNAPVILVNGLPGAGKTTLARVLSRRLQLPLFSKDVIKEVHADVFGAAPLDDRPQRHWNNESFRSSLDRATVQAVTARSS